MKNIILLALIVFPSVAFAQFVSITDIPAINEAATQDNLTGLINYLYLLCIGVGSSIAVLQFVRAGVMYAGEAASMSKKEEAKKIIRGTIFGLILLLSPYIVFSIIDERITTLNLDVGGLQLQNNNGNGGAGGDQQQGGDSNDGTPGGQEPGGGSGDDNTDQEEPECEAGFQAPFTASGWGECEAIPVETETRQFSVANPCGNINNPAGLDCSKSEVWVGWAPANNSSGQFVCNAAVVMMSEYAFSANQIRQTEQCTAGTPSGYTTLKACQQRPTGQVVSFEIPTPACSGWTSL
jgi:hypothetical protein